MCQINQPNEIHDGPSARVYTLCGIALLLVILIATVVSWRMYPLFIDTYYHMGVIEGFSQAGGITTRAFWELAPGGRVHIYPPSLHVIGYFLTLVGMSPRTYITLVSAFCYARVHADHLDMAAADNRPAVGLVCLDLFVRTVWVLLDPGGVHRGCGRDGFGPARIFRPGNGPFSGVRGAKFYRDNDAPHRAFPAAGACDQHAFAQKKDRGGLDGRFAARGSLRPVAGPHLGEPGVFAQQPHGRRDFTRRVRRRGKSGVVPGPFGPAFHPLVDRPPRAGTGLDRALLGFAVVFPMGFGGRFLSLNIHWPLACLAGYGLGEMVQWLEKRASLRIGAQILSFAVAGAALVMYPAINSQMGRFMGGPQGGPQGDLPGGPQAHRQMDRQVDRQVDRNPESPRAPDCGKNWSRCSLIGNSPSNRRHCRNCSMHIRAKGLIRQRDPGRAARGKIAKSMPDLAWALDEIKRPAFKWAAAA